MSDTTCEPTAEAEAPHHSVANRMRIMCRIAAWMLLLVGVVLTAVLVWAQLPGNRGRCCLGRTVLVVGSGSMSPAIEAGDLVMVRRIDPAEVARIRVGSVVTFRVPEHETMVVTHRVIDVSRSPDGGAVIRTKGDANQYPDSFSIGPEHLVGAVVWRVPRLGRVLMNLRTGRFLLAVALMLVLARLAMTLWMRALHGVAARSGQ